MTKTKGELIERLKQLTGEDREEWKSMHNHVLIAKIQEMKDARKQEVLVDGSFSERLTGTLNKQ